MNPLNRRRLIANLAAAACVAAWPAAAQTDAATADRPLRVILPVGAGSGVDTIFRAIGPAFSKALNGRPLVIENLAGAGGVTGTSTLVKALADASTIGVLSNNHAVNPSVFKNLPYDSIADITPISVIGATPFVLVVNPARMPVNNVGEMVALLKSRPGEFNYASSGNGTILHLGAEMFVQQAGVKAVHVPYKGVGPMVNDLIGGQVDFGVLAVPAAQAHLASGKLRAIGVCMRQRIPQLPELPTLAEQGLPDYEIAGWFAMVAPARLPAAEVQRFHAAVVAAVNSAEVKEAMARQGNIVRPTTPKEAERFMRSEQERYAELVKKAGVKLD